MTESCDVLVAGAGPAGAIAARALALAGLSVVVADRVVASHPKMGETLPAAAIRLLNEIGLGDLVADQRRIQSPVTGMLIAWNDAAFVANEACNDPYGRGLRLDRAPFDVALRQAAQAAGAIRYCAWVTSVQRRQGGWRVELDDERTLQAGWLIDATGRRARLARLIGQRRQRGAPLVALYRAVQPERNQQLNCTIITAGPDGWIYAGRCADGRWLFGYHTTPHQAALLRTQPACWNDILATSPSLGDLLGSLTFEPAVHAHDARSAWLDSPIGEGWVAVGDAALAFDPIAGQGLFSSLYTGMNAAKVIRSAGSGVAAPAYADELARVVAIYAARRRALYGQERRWRERPFWQMHGGVTMLDTGSADTPE